MVQRSRASGSWDNLVTYVFVVAQSWLAVRSFTFRPTCLHLATHDMWSWCGRKGILTELSLCYSIVATRFRPPSATVVSAEPFLHGTGTLQCLQKEMATYRHWSVSLWRDPDDVSHCRIVLPDKTKWQLISATLRMKMLFRGWPVMVNDTRRRSIEY